MAEGLREYLQEFNDIGYDVKYEALKIVKDNFKEALRNWQVYLYTIKRLNNFVMNYFSLNIVMSVEAIQKIMSLIYCWVIGLLDVRIRKLINISVPYTEFELSMAHIYKHKKRLGKRFIFTLKLIDYMIDTGFNVDFLYYDYDFSTNLRVNND